MKKNATRYSIVPAALALVLGSPGFLSCVSVAEEATGVKPTVERASTVMGLTVKNPAGEEVGKVKDIILTPDHQRIQSFQLAMASSQGGKNVLAEPSSVSLASDRKALTYREANPAAEGVLQPEPPAPESLMPDTLPADAEAQPAEFDIGVAESISPLREPGESQFVSNLLGLDLRDSNGESIGKIRDLLLDLNQSRVVNATVGVGGILGLGEKLATVEWSAVNLNLDQKFASVQMAGDELKELAYSESEYWEHLGFSGSEQATPEPVTEPVPEPVTEPLPLPIPEPLP